jgi:membrane-associated phospholipid phosphatase
MADESGTVSEKRDGALETEIVVSPRRAALRAYRGEVVFGAALVLYAALAGLAHYYAYFGWDLRLELSIQSITLPGFNTLMKLISVLGNGWVPVAAVGIAGLALVFARLRIECLICVIGVASGAGVNGLFKAWISRPRPTEPLVQVAYDVAHESFPSGHVVFFIEFFGFLFFLSYVLLKAGAVRRVALALCGTLIALVGVSRVYLGAHWPSDVVGAYLAGGMWLMLMIEMYRRLKSKQRS